MEKPPKRRRRRSFGFWVAVVLVTGGVLYPLSFGPACWIVSRSVIEPDDTKIVSAPEWLNSVYRPLLYAMTMDRLPFIGGPLHSYASLGVPRGIMIGLTIPHVRTSDRSTTEYPRLIWISAEQWGYGGSLLRPAMARDEPVESPR